MRKILFIIPFFLWTCGGGSSPTSSNDNDGDDGDDGNSGIGPITIGIAISLPQGYEVKEAYDGGYIIAAGSFGTSNENMYLIKTDASGNEEWSKSFGEEGTQQYGKSVQPTSDGGYIIAGNTEAGGYHEDWDFYVVKTDASGNEEWSKSFGKDLPDAHERVKSIRTTYDGGYIILGNAGCFCNGYSDFDMYIVKINASGNEQWNRIYEDVGFLEESIEATSDGGYIISGYQNSRMTLFKIDASGNEEWTQSYEGRGRGNDVQITSDGGYIMTGSTDDDVNSNKWDGYLVKTDASGNEEWSKSFRKSAGLSDWFNSVKETSDGGYITVGYTTTPGPYYDMYVVKTDASGNEMWSRTFGGSRDDGAYSVDTTSDGGFIIMGETTSYTLTGRKIYLVKIDSEGNQIF